LVTSSAAETTCSYFSAALLSSSAALFKLVFVVSYFLLCSLAISDSYLATSSSKALFSANVLRSIFLSFACFIIVCFNSFISSVLTVLAYALADNGM